MADKIIRDSSLTAIANAIRSKARTSGSMVFPQGFISTLENMSNEATGYKVATGIISFPTKQESFSLNFDFNVISGLMGLLEIPDKTITYTTRKRSFTTRAQSLLVDSSSKMHTTGTYSYSFSTSGDLSKYPDFTLNGGNVSWARGETVEDVLGVYFYMFWGS